MTLFPAQKKLRLTWLSLLVVLGVIVYLPGISGPWLFDDFSNILRNTFIRITALDADSLYHAAYSLQAGPLMRPVAMLSFALNYYFAGGFTDTTSYKLTNLAIHGLNGLLIFWLVRLILTRVDSLRPAARARANTSVSVSTKAALVALLWMVHPIQLTSVLYVVQRMTELSALFMLLGMIGYLKGRTRIIDGRPHGVWLMLVSLCATLALGMLSKENAVLLPVFVLVMEFTLFSGELPWRRWPELSAGAKYLILAFVIVSAVVLLVGVVDYAAGGYHKRSFTLAQRALTETRVLVFYISLIVLPRINAFGLYHDDIALSTSLVDPWTTLFSIVFLVSLLCVALITRKKHPLLCLGILWYFVGHLLESTIIPLEIAHEHRNYIASLGALLCLFYFFDWAARKYNNRKLWLSLPVLIVVFGSVTTLRAWQWSNELLLHTYEALHHPDSAIIQSSLASELTKYGRYREAKEAMHTAARLSPDDASHLIWLHMLAARQKAVPDADEQKRLVELLATKPITPTTDMMIENAIGCMQSWCSTLREHMETWLRTILARENRLDKSYYYYLLGITLASQNRLPEASEQFRLSFEADPRYLHPLFKLAAIYVHQGRLNEAEQTLEMLRKANTGNLHPRNKEIDAIAADIRKLKNERQP
jgi:tetratricopeptide (TPR) repeat protein